MTRDVPTLIGMLGGLAHRRELLRAGVTRRQIEASWAAGEIMRVRHGLYGLDSLPAAVIRAARSGGTLSGATSLAVRGAWQTPSPRLVVSVAHNAQDLRDPDDAGSRLDPDRDDVVVLRDGDRFDPRTERLLASPSRAAAQVLVTERPEYAAAIIDSAMRLPFRQRPDLDAVMRHVARRRSRTGDVVSIDPRAEAGTESVARVRLLREGITAEPQVWVDEAIRVDLLIDGWLVVECVSVGHHSSPADYKRDRARILRLMTLGYVVVEATYEQILFDWPAVRDAVATALAGRAEKRGPAHFDLTASSRR